MSMIYVFSCHTNIEDGNLIKKNWVVSLVWFYMLEMIEKYIITWDERVIKSFDSKETCGVFKRIFFIILFHIQKCHISNRYEWN